MNRDQQIVQPCKAPGLFDDEVPATADQETQLDHSLRLGIDRAQIAARAHLFGDDPSIPRVALRLAASSALAGPIDGQPRHVHDALARIEQHGGHQTSDPADDIDSHSAFAAQGHKFGSQCGEFVWRVRHALIEHHVAELGERRDPMHVFGDVNTDRESHPDLQLKDVPRDDPHRQRPTQR